MLRGHLPHKRLDDLGEAPGKRLDVSVYVARGQAELWHVDLLPEARACF